MKGHCFYTGRTMSGKTFAAVEMCRLAHEAGAPTIVVDPLAGEEGEHHWAADILLPEPMEALRIAKQARGCEIFIDEAAIWFGQGKESKPLEWLLTQSRHRGHRVHLISQRSKMVAPNFRDQCANLFLFRVSSQCARDWHDQFAEDLILEAPTLKPREFILVTGDGEPARKMMLEKAESA